MNPAIRDFTKEQAVDFQKQIINSIFNVKESLILNCLKKLEKGNLLNKHLS
jgi:hypothetical protein